MSAAGTGAPAQATALGGRTIFGHPAGLYILFFTEMWERFSYYGMRSLLVLYMVNHLFLQPDVGQRVLGFNAIKGGLEAIFGPLGNQPLSSQIYGLYTAFVYFTPFFGGMLADRVLGQRRTVVLGGVLMAIGHFLMAVEHLFFVALLFLIFGNGAFKPNISTQVGSLYPPGDPRRDGAFTIFYMGVNLGAFLSPFVCGTLGQTVGWHYGFGAAGVGMIVGLILYLWGRRYLAPEPRSERGRPAGRVATDPAPTDTVDPRTSSSGRSSSGRTSTGRQPLTPDEKKRVWALVVLCALNIVFWAVYEQQGNTMQLWADQNTNWRFAGLRIPSTWYQSFNPLMIFLLAPILDRFWLREARRGRQMSSVTKMAVGCFLLGLSYVVMILAAQGLATPETRRSVMWLAGTTFILTLGELYLSPIGLSLVTKVSPVRIVSTMMGVWFLSSFFGNYLSGYLGTYWEKMPRAAFFLMLTLLGVGAGVAMLIVNRPLKRIVGRHE